jgi:hypothetical protein
MAFTQVTHGAISFVPRSEGIYVKSTLDFADPRDDIKLTPNTLSRKSQRYSGGVTGTSQKEVTAPSGDISLDTLRVNISWDTSKNFSTAELLAEVQKTMAFFSDAANAGFLAELMQGKV